MTAGRRTPGALQRMARQPQSIAKDFAVRPYGMSAAEAAAGIASGAISGGSVGAPSGGGEGGGSPREVIGQGYDRP